MKYEETIRSLCGGSLLSEDDVRRLGRAASVRHLERGEVLIDIGDVPKSVYFLLDGVMRAYLLDVSGKDVTDCLIAERGCVVMPSADLVEPSGEVIDAVVPSDVLVFDMACVIKLLESSLSMNRFYSYLACDAVRRHRETKHVLSRCKARERYRWFLDAYPGLIDRVPNRYVASFLGMTPVTLSRLRTSMRGGVCQDNAQGMDSPAANTFQSGTCI